MVFQVNKLSEFDLSKIYPEDIIQIKVLNNDNVSTLLEISKKIGCKLIYLDHHLTHFYFKETRSKLREKTINDLLSDI